MGCRRHEVLIKICLTHWNTVIDLLHCILNELLACNAEGAGAGLSFRSAWILSHSSDFLFFIFLIYLILVSYCHRFIWSTGFAWRSFFFFFQKTDEIFVNTDCDGVFPTYLHLARLLSNPICTNCIPCPKRNNKDSFPSPARHAWWQADDSNQVRRINERL